MWHEVVGWALLVAINPLMIAGVLLVISRPRPLPNLAVFWVSGIVLNIPCMLIPLLGMHLVPSFTAFAKSMAAVEPGSSVKPMQLGTGIIGLIVAAALLVRSRRRQQVTQPAAVPVGTDGTVLVLENDVEDALEDADTTANPPAPGRIRRAAAAVGSLVRRFLHRIQEAWDSGDLWVSAAFAVFYIAPPPLTLVIDTVIVASGAPLATQLLAAPVFALLMFLFTELVLVGYVIAPRRTEALLNPLHDWLATHRLIILSVLFGVTSVWQVLTGVGIFG